MLSIPSNKWQAPIVLMRKLTHKCFVNADWESYQPAGDANIVLASHVVYYFQDKPAAVHKMLDTLSPEGRALFVVNGNDADYGPLKLAFAEMIGKLYSFTVDELRETLGDRVVGEHVVRSELDFESPQKLFEALRLSFDNHPQEYEQHRSAILDYFRTTVSSRHFGINQVIIEAR